jgi:hypothetical protein
MLQPVARAIFQKSDEDLLTYVSPNCIGPSSLHLRVHCVFTVCTLCVLRNAPDVRRPLLTYDPPSYGPPPTDLLLGQHTCTAVVYIPSPRASPHCLYNKVSEIKVHSMFSVYCSRVHAF